MKWTTRADAQSAHWTGFKASERTTVPCNHNCKTFVRNGQKYVSHYHPSGCGDKEETLTVNLSSFPPQGQRGTWRRGQKKMGVNNP